MSRLSEAERRQFDVILANLRTTGPHLEPHRDVARAFADKLRALFPEVDEVSIGRVLHQAAMETAMCLGEGVSLENVMTVFSLAAVDLVATDLGGEAR